MIRGLFIFMIKHYETPSIYGNLYGEVYRCQHAVYDICTLYKIGEKGLAVIQQRFDPQTKHTWWSDIDAWLTDEVYTNGYFKEFFDKNASAPIDGIYPTFSVRQIMHALKMKPLRKDVWETVFDGTIKNSLIYERR